MGQGEMNNPTDKEAAFMREIIIIALLRKLGGSTMLGQVEMEEISNDLCNGDGGIAFRSVGDKIKITIESIAESTAYVN